MSDFDRHSRLNKFDKRRKNTKTISILLVIGSILLIILLGTWIFGGKNDNASEEKDNNSSDLVIEEDEGDNADVASEESSDDEESANNETDEETSGDGTNENDEEIETEQAEPSDDNVKEAYTGNWRPIGTEQEGPHTTQFNEDTQDWLEMERAASVAAELDEASMITWYIAGGGDQKAIATVSDANQTEFYRVYISWIENEGWQPTKVEILKENDKQ